MTEDVRHLLVLVFVLLLMSFLLHLHAQWRIAMLKKRTEDLLDICGGIIKLYEEHLP